MIFKVPKTEAALQRIVAHGEGPSLEFKRSTGELKEAMQTACAFLNGDGGLVVFGIRPDGAAEGQQVSDKTLRDIAQVQDGFEPPARIEVERLRIRGGREVLLLPVGGLSDSIPFTFNGRAYERSGSTTRAMPKERYEELLLEQAHSRRRWENQPAETSTRDIDRDEVIRIVRTARESGRLLGLARGSLPDLLSRLGVRHRGRILRAAVVLFGRRFLPDYPQCELRMARFRGTDKQEFLDQRQTRGPAFRLLEEAEVFCQRHLPVPAKIVPGRLQRVESPLIPSDAMREILVNAFVHRDYSIAGGAVSLAIFDDRVEVWSAGKFPRGITAEVLSRDHPSVPRNPIIADVFHRAAYIERWGRGTNRVIEMCRSAGTPAPEFAEIAGSAVVTFRVAVGRTAQVTGQVTAQVTGQVTRQVADILLAAANGPISRQALQTAAGIAHREHFRVAHLEPLLKRGLIERTIPDKPNSRLQRYRLTDAGRRLLPQARRLRRTRRNSPRAKP